MNRDIVRADELVQGDWVSLYGQVFDTAKCGRIVTVKFYGGGIVEFKASELVALI